MILLLHPPLALLLLVGVVVDFEDGADDVQVEEVGHTARHHTADDGAEKGIDASGDGHRIDQVFLIPRCLYNQIIRQLEFEAGANGRIRGF